MKQFEIQNIPICLRTELRKEFVKRCKINPAYSLRAYARFLEIDQSLLSKLINGQRNFSEALIDKISVKLKINGLDKLRILQSKGSDVISYIQLADDEVALLSDEIHFELLELSKTKDFRLDFKWIGERLGAHPQRIQEALDRLIRMKFVLNENGQLEILRSNNNWTNNLATSVAKQELQRNVLKKSQEALENVEFSNREHGSLTVAIRKDRLPEFKEKLKQIRNELDAFFQPEEDKDHFDEVYQLSVSFFPVTKINNKKDKK